MAHPTKRGRAWLAACLLLTVGAAVGTIPAAAQGTAPPAVVPSSALALRFSPVLLEVRAPQNTSVFRVWNESAAAAAVQIRVFRWTQRIDAQGRLEDVLEPTTDVVASPPITVLQPGVESLIRIVRTSTRALTGEENYRLIVDQLPTDGPAATGVSFRFRFSLPVFFSALNASAAAPIWSVEATTQESRDANNNLLVTQGYQVRVQNAGDKRLRLTNLLLTDPVTGVVFGRHDGLVGYVLGRSQAQWFVPAVAGTTSGTQLRLSVTNETGLTTVIVNLAGR